jgi:hypothetical protein
MGVIVHLPFVRAVAFVLPLLRCLKLLQKLAVIPTVPTTYQLALLELQPRYAAELALTACRSLA